MPFKRLFREDPEVALAPRAAWTKSFAGFLGFSAVSRAFEINGRTDEEYEWIWNAPIYEKPFWRSPSGYEIRTVDPDFEPPTVVLLAPDGSRCGFYSGGQLWVDPEHRGQGLGAELVLALTEALGYSITAVNEGLGLSPEGYRAHFKAWRFAVERAKEQGLIPESSVQRVY